MYDYLKGLLTFSSPNKITLDVKGVGYLLYIPFNSFAKLPKIGTELLFYTSLIIKEDAHQLFGFLEKKERELFETLIALSGIGPKTALSIIGHINYDQLFLAVAKADVKSLTKIPGLGKKSAEKLIIEMRDKIKNLETIELANGPIEKGPFHDALSALMRLGYSAIQAQSALKQASEHFKNKEPSVSELIATALRQKI